MDAAAIYQFEVKTSEGNIISMKEYQNNTLLIVNVASKCGFTKQYAELEALYRKYKHKNFVILAFPCNQFGNQEPGTDAEIKKFCSLNYDVTFPVMAKIEVNGDKTTPLYKHLKSEATGILFTESIKWNFTKFLVDKFGKVLKRFSPDDSADVIEKELIKIL